MEFRLFYNGKLRANGSREDKQELRRAFHPQLQVLWEQLPLSTSAPHLLKPSNDSKTGVIKEIGAFHFAPLVCKRYHLVAELDILFLRAEAPGQIITKGGDLDNRIKTLFDGLRMPNPRDNEIPDGDNPGQDETPFFCLLEDDSLITHFSVTSDRLLIRPTREKEKDVVLIISVSIRAVVKTWLGLDLG
jgi:hypothetical protein